MVTLDPDHLLRLRALARRREPPRSVTAMPGGFVTRARGQGLETADLRAFADGDDPRHIDRNATARSGRLQVRNFQAERDRALLLVADFRPSMLWGTRRTLRSIAAAEALSMIGWRAVTEGARVGLLAVSAGAQTFVRPRARDRAMVAVIGAMVEAHAAALSDAARPDPPLSATLELAHRLASPRVGSRAGDGAGHAGPRIRRCGDGAGAAHGVPGRAYPGCVRGGPARRPVSLRDAIGPGRVGGADRRS